jgi:hypothetical protein
VVVAAGQPGGLLPALLRLQEEQDEEEEEGEEGVGGFDLCSLDNVPRDAEAVAEGLRAGAVAVRGCVLGVGVVSRVGGWVWSWWWVWMGEGRG